MWGRNKLKKEYPECFCVNCKFFNAGNCHAKETKKVDYVTGKTYIITENAANKRLFDKCWRDIPEHFCPEYKGN